MENRVENLFMYSRRIVVQAFEKAWCPGAESNHRHCDFQSHALPTELPGRRERPQPGLCERRVIVSGGGRVHLASPCGFARRGLAWRGAGGRGKLREMNGFLVR